MASILAMSKEQAVRLRELPINFMKVLLLV